MDTALTKISLGSAEKIGLFGCGRSSLSLIRRLSGKAVTLRSEEKIAPSVIRELPSCVRVFDGERAFDEADEDVLYPLQSREQVYLALSDALRALSEKE